MKTPQHVDDRRLHWRPLCRSLPRDQITSVRYFNTTSSVLSKLLYSTTVPDVISSESKAKSF